MILISVLIYLFIGFILTSYMYKKNISGFKDNLKNSKPILIIFMIEWPVIPVVLIMAILYGYIFPIFKSYAEWLDK